MCRCVTVQRTSHACTLAGRHTSSYPAGLDFPAVINTSDSSGIAERFGCVARGAPLQWSRETMHRSDCQPACLPANMALNCGWNGGGHVYVCYIGTYDVCNEKVVAVEVQVVAVV
jgi:hypothetical protein